MIPKMLLALAGTLTVMSLLAMASGSCTHEGKEYEERTALVIDGKCHVCNNGEWQPTAYNLPAERCKGKL